MSGNRADQKQGARKLANSLEKQAQPERKAWVRPEVKRLDAGAAEATQINGVPDGGPPGQSRS